MYPRNCDRCKVELEPDVDPPSTHPADKTLCIPCGRKADPLIDAHYRKFDSTESEG